MDAPTNRGIGGRARGRGRGGTAPRAGQGSQGTPLAAQLKQLDRLQEPEEMAVLRRFKDLGATQIQSTYGLTGLLDRKVQMPGSSACLVIKQVPDGPELVWVSLLQADAALSAKRSKDELERALARREVRLPEARRRVSWASLTPEEKRLCLLSQKEWNSFRAQRVGQAPSGAATK